MTMYPTEALQRAIVARYQSDAWLTANTRGIHFCEAPKGTAAPFCAYFLDAQIDPTAQGASRLYRLQVNAYSDSQSPKECGDVIAALARIYGGAQMALTDNVLAVAPQLESEQLFRDEADRWQGTAIFTLRVQ